MPDGLDVIEQLRYYLTLQLEAHLNGDQDRYNELEQTILRLEKRL